MPSSKPAHTSTNPSSQRRGFARKVEFGPNPTAAILAARMGIFANLVCSSNHDGRRPGSAARGRLPGGRPGFKAVRGRGPQIELEPHGALSDNLRDARRLPRAQQLARTVAQDLGGVRAREAGDDLAGRIYQLRANGTSAGVGVEVKDGSGAVHAQEMGSERSLADGTPPGESSLSQERRLRNRSSFGAMSVVVPAVVNCGSSSDLHVAWYGVNPSPSPTCPSRRAAGTVRGTGTSRRRRARARAARTGCWWASRKRPAAST